MMVLVTGGAGYIGSHVVKELLARGYGTVALDDLRTGHQAAMPGGGVRGAGGGTHHRGAPDPAGECLRGAGADESGEIGEDHRPETHLVPIVLQAALGKREKVTVYGDDYPTPDGTCVRD